MFLKPFDLSHFNEARRHSTNNSFSGNVAAHYCFSCNHCPVSDANTLQIDRNGTNRDIVADINRRINRRYSDASVVACTYILVEITNVYLSRNLDSVSDHYFRMAVEYNVLIHKYTIADY